MLNTKSTEAANSIHNTHNIKKEHDLLSESVTYFQDIHVELLSYYFSNSVAIQKVKQKKNYPSCPPLAPKAHCQTAKRLKHVVKRASWGSSSAFRSDL